MSTIIKIMYPDGRAELEPRKRPLGYDAIKEIVAPYLDGGHLEHVTVLYDGKRRDMFVDEDGHNKGLARNDDATKVYRNNWLTQHPGTDPESLPWIAGVAILFTDQIVWN